jgi:hypothetical protein
LPQYVAGLTPSTASLEGGWLKVVFNEERESGAALQ